DGLHEIIGLDWAARNIDDRHARFRTPVPTEIIGESHCAGGIASHGVDASISGARPGGNDGQCLGREAINPFTGGNRLTGLRIRTLSRPVAFALDLLVGDRALDDKDKRIELALFGFVEEFYEVVA